MRKTGAVASGIIETVFRAPGMEITLKYEDLREDKRHGWLGLLDKP